MIEEIEIKNYIPLLTKGTKHISLNLNNIVNIFMGRNGFGKTSLLKICSLTVPDSNDFEDGGFRYLKFKDPRNNVVYELLSKYGKEGVQSFKIDGKEHNTANNQTVQKSLCERHFKINNQVNKNITGLKVNDLFTFMSPMKRKELFMLMYPNDVTYALNVYNKIKAEYKHTQGALKNQLARLVDEKERNKTLLSKTPEELEIDLKDCEKEIKDCLYLQGTFNDVVYEDEEHNLLIRKFNSLLDKAINYSLGKKYFSIEESKQDLNLKMEYLKKCEDRILILTENINKISQSLSGTNLRDMNIEEVKTSFHNQERLVKDTEIEINVLREHISNNDNLKDLTDDKIHFFSNYADNLIRYLNVLVICSNKDLKMSTYSKWLDVLESKRNQLRGLNKTRDDLIHELKHFESSETIECPDCKFKFKKGFKIETIGNKRVLLKNTKETIDLLIKEIEILDNKIENDSEWYSSMRSLVSFIKQNDIDKTLTELLLSYDVGHVSTDQLINDLKMCQSYCDLANKLEYRKSELETLRIKYKTLSDHDTSMLIRMYDDAETHLGEAQYKAYYLREEIKSHNKEIEDYNAFNLLLDLLRETRESIMQSFVNCSKMEVKKTIEHKLSRLVPNKDNILSELIRKRSHDSVLESITLDIERLKHREANLKILMDGLCPNKGLIASLMLDFIKNVCGNMNAIIKEIFSTPLYIRPCQKTNGDLNYQFPVINGDNKKSITADVSDCSGGESDVINLAFRLVLISYYAPFYPLFMDEVGTKLDEYHQNRFFDYIRRLSLSGKITQMFMVSHFTSHINMFDYANVLALNSEGISLPRNVKHIKEI